MNDFELVEHKDAAGNEWTLCNEKTGEFVYVGYEFVRENSDVRYKIIGGYPPTKAGFPEGTIEVKKVGIDGPINSDISTFLNLNFNQKSLNFRWKRL